MVDTSVAASSTEPKPLARKERSKSRESAKKMGGGKKGLWSKTNEPVQIPDVDVGDPNYDSEKDDDGVLLVPVVPNDNYERSYGKSWEGPAPKIDLGEYKKKITSILDEYFTSEDAIEVARSAKELESLAFNYELVKRSITMAIDRKEREKELTSRLLSSLYQDVLTRADVGKAFERLLENVDDLQVDAPSAREDLATFLARAVVDEVLPPAYLSHPVVGQLAQDVVEKAKLKLSIKHGTARVEKAWGPGDGRPVEELKLAVDDLMQEYLLSRDLSEAARCVRELNSPPFHPEVVKRGIVIALDKDEDNRQAMSSLLAYLVTAEQLVSTGHIVQGFNRLFTILDDLKLDVPRAADYLEEFKVRAVADGCLPESYSSGKQGIN